MPSRDWREPKPAEEVEPESTDNGEPRENPGEKPGKNADNLRGGTKEDTDCGKKILTRKRQRASEVVEICELVEGVREGSKFPPFLFNAKQTTYVFHDPFHSEFLEKPR